MKLTYLGTAAAEGWPALYCSCEGCKTARINKGKDIRTRSQAIINDDLLIDFGPDTYLHVLNYGLNLDLVKNIIVTHSHDDHLAPADLFYRTKGFCAVRPNHVIGIYGNDKVIEKICDVANTNNQLDTLLVAMSLNEIEAYSKNEIGNYTVYSLLANHKKGENCFIYIIQDKAGKTILYAHDTGFFPQETWDFIKNFKFNLVSLDCNHGKEDCINNHMGMKCCAMVKDNMIKMGVTNDDCKFILHHFSHNCYYLSHEEIVQDAKEYGFDVSYDTKVVEI